MDAAITFILAHKYIKLKEYLDKKFLNEFNQEFNWESSAVNKRLLKVNSK